MPTASSKRTTKAQPTSRTVASAPSRAPLVRFTRQSMLGGHPVYVNPANVLWVDALPEPIGSLGAAPESGGAAIYVSGSTMLPLVVSESIDEVVKKLNGATAA